LNILTLNTLLPEPSVEVCMHKRYNRHSLIPLILSLLLAACGGGGGSGADPIIQQPGDTAPAARIINGGISVQSPIIIAGQSTRLSAVLIEGFDPDHLENCR
jgi:hypothetical protein